VENSAHSWPSCSRVRIALYTKYQTERKSCGMLARSTVVMKGTKDLGGRIVRALLESRKLIETLFNGLGSGCNHLG
jgi:hypothetical protein